MTEHTSVKLSDELFQALVGADILALIYDRAPRKVLSRVGNALRHFIKAHELCGIDEEMAVIRLIAAEEELVVAIFEILKLNAGAMPEHGDFIRKYKDHQVKLALSPVLAELKGPLVALLESGISFDGLEDHLRWSVNVVRSGDRVVVQISDESGKHLFDHNPFDISLELTEGSEDQAVATLFADLKARVLKHDMSLRDFVAFRADFRNKLLYADDAGTFSMGNSAAELIQDTFSKTLSDLLWCVALLTSAHPLQANWGLVSQCIAVYRMVLVECNIIKLERTKVAAEVGREAPVRPEP
jgi:hypothetical protein